MEKTGYIEIHIQGKLGNLDLTPEYYDIRDLSKVIEQVEHLLTPTDKKNRPIISYHVEQGSVRHLFKTSIQLIIGFNAILGQINAQNNIDFLESETAKAVEYLQELAKKNDYIYSLKTSLDNSAVVKISSESHFQRTESIWVEAEFYFYGKVTNAGGKDKANIHLSTEEFGTIRIQTPIEFLSKYEDNLLYKTFGVRVLGKQHIETGEIDKQSLSFLELIDYDGRYNESYLDTLIEKSSPNWSDISDADSWLRELRGYKHAE